MISREEVKSQLGRADPYPGSKPLPSELVAEKPSVEQIMGVEVSLSRTRWSRNPRRGPLVAVASGLAVIAVGLVVGLMTRLTDAPPAQPASPIDVTIPNQPLDSVFPVEPSGSGPALVWEAASLPFGAMKAEWLVADDDRFYLSIIGSSELGPGVYWLSSEDGRSWNNLTPTGDQPHLDPQQHEPNNEVTAWDGKVVAISFPEVFTLDVRSGRFEAHPLKLPDGYTNPETWCEPDDQCAPDVTLTAGSRGALIVVKGPDPQSIAAWHSNDGFEWSPAGELPIHPSLVGAVARGFVLVGPASGGCGVWHSEDAMEWEHIHNLSECPLRLFSWNDQAVAVYADSLWTISPSGVSPIIPEELSVLRGGKLMIAAGQGGIVVPYDAIPPDWDFEDDGLWPPVNAVVEYSPDGRQWSRSVLPGETGSTVEIVGTTTVLLRERGIYIGTAES